MSALAIWHSSLTADEKSASGTDDPNAVNAFEYHSQLISDIGTQLKVWLSTRNARKLEVGFYVTRIS